MQWLELKILPVLQVLIAGALIKLAITCFPQAEFPRLSFQFSQSPFIAGLILLLAIVIGIYAIVNFKQHGTTVNPVKIDQASTVVDSGIYAYSRNPMYLAMLLALIAGAVYSENWLSFVSVVAFIFYITRFQIIPEERMLTKMFGQAYRDYCLKVRRWL